MITLKIKTMAEVVANGETVEYLFWVGCAGSFDERAQKITKALAKILQAANVSFAVLGTEETCTGDPAKRAGNEFLFQMQALQNITTLNNYGVKKLLLLVLTALIHSKMNILNWVDITKSFTILSSFKNLLMMEK